MKLSLISGSCVALLMAGLTLPAWAEDPHKGHGSMAHGKTICKASEVMDVKVKNAQGEDLGEIEDLAIDADRGRIAYAVLSFGGFLGMGEKLFAVPWSSLQSLDSKSMRLDVDKSRLESAPGFDKKDWPDMANAQWGQDVHTYYGQKPYWDDDLNRSTPEGDRMAEGHRNLQGAGRILKASDLIGMNIENYQDENVGEIQNLAIDSNRGHIAYAILSFGGFAGIGDKLFAIPWQSFDVRSDKELALDVNKERLENAPSFDKNKWPDMNDRQWITNVYVYYNVRPYWEEGQGDWSTSHTERERSINVDRDRDRDRNADQDRDKDRQNPDRHDD